MQRDAPVVRSGPRPTPLQLIRASQEGIVHCPPRAVRNRLGRGPLRTTEGSSPPMAAGQRYSAA
jgi:hypothetical protein